ncbi:MAG: response regulator transcription factor [Actinomycetota bacterium]|jgi:two-component system response regulator DesR|nr:response regulator transcription factor [Actinomycetota bacterium]
MIRVLLVEDQVMMREALATLLSLEPDIEVVAQVSSGAHVLPAARRSNPDVALIDIEMPDGDGLDAAAELRRELPAIKVLIVTAFGRPGFLRRAMDSGASGYLLKDRPSRELAAAIRRALAGDTVVDPELALAALTAGDNPLTPKELEVLCAARDQATVADIAEVLHLSGGTVKNHLSVVINKLGARNRSDAVRIAQDQGWLAPPPARRSAR